MITQILHLAVNWLRETAARNPTGNHGNIQGNAHYGLTPIHPSLVGWPSPEAEIYKYPADSTRGVKKNT